MTTGMRAEAHKTIRWVFTVACIGGGIWGSSAYLSNIMDKQLGDAATTVSRLKKKHAAEIEVMKLDHASQLEALQKKHGTEWHALEKEHDAEEASLETRALAAERNCHARIKAAITKCEHDIAEIRGRVWDIVCDGSECSRHRVVNGSEKE